MESKIHSKIKFPVEPIAILITEKKPENAVQNKEGVWSCAMFNLAAAANGKTAVFTSNTCGCVGSGTGLGFGNHYKSFFGGEESCYYYLSVGNNKWEHGKEQAKNMGLPDDDDFVVGMGMYKSPEIAKKYVEDLPITDNKDKFVVFKPLKEVDEKTEMPESIVFLCNMDQLALLTVLANFERNDNNGVISPRVSACQAMGIYTFRENKSNDQKAVIGLLDPTGRIFVKQTLKKDCLSFSMPYALFKEMEGNLDKSVASGKYWNILTNLC